MSSAQPDTHRQFVTGAVVVIPMLFIVTLEATECAGFIPCPDRSGIWEYTGRSQAAMRPLFFELQRFIAESGINRIVLRAGADRGNHVAGPPAFKIETSLQLITDLAVNIINTKSISCWFNRDDPSLPQPTMYTGKKLRHNGELFPVSTNGTDLRL